MMDTEQFKELTEGLIRLQTEKVTPNNRREEELTRYHSLSKADELMETESYERPDEVEDIDFCYGCCLMQPLEMALCHHWPTG